MSKSLNNYAIIASNLTKFYGDLLAVDHVNFRVRRGEIYGFLGPNGAGKTTTIRMLCGLTRISYGDAFIFGYNVRRESARVKSIIGVVQDISNLYMELSCFDNLMFCAEMYGVPKSERKKRTLELLEFFGLLERREAKFKELSKGLKRRLVIAAAMVHRPHVLFLDEPTIGLDVKSKRQIWRLIRELNDKGLTIFLTTHNIYEAFNLCDRIAIINKGKIIAEGPPAELRKKVGGEKVLEIQTSPIVKDIKIFANLRGVVNARIERGVYHIVVNDIVLALEEILHVIKRYNLDIISISLRGADAEEVFIKLIGESE